MMKTGEGWLLNAVCLAPFDAAVITALDDVSADVRPEFVVLASFGCFIEPDAYAVVWMLLVFSQVVSIVDEFLKEIRWQILESFPVIEAGFVIESENHHGEVAGRRFLFHAADTAVVTVQNGQVHLGLS